MTHLNLNRPAFVPDAYEARLALAYDLARCDLLKTRLLLKLPLFEVAVDGKHGMRLAENMQRALCRRAA